MLIVLPPTVPLMLFTEENINIRGTQHGFTFQGLELVGLRFRQFISTNAKHDVEQGVEQSSTRRTSLDVDGVQSRPSFSRDVREESARDLIF